MRYDVEVIRVVSTGRYHVRTRTSIGTFQSVCDELGEMIDVSDQILASRSEAERIGQDFMRSSAAFENWWRRPQ